MPMDLETLEKEYQNRDEFATLSTPEAAETRNLLAQIAHKFQEILDILQQKTSSTTDEEPTTHI